MYTKRASEKLLKARIVLDLHDVIADSKKVVLIEYAIPLVY